MRAMYEERIRKLRLRRVAFRTMWLSAEEYPLLLGNPRQPLLLTWTLYKSDVSFM